MKLQNNSQEQNDLILQDTELQNHGNSSNAFKKPPQAIEAANNTVGVFISSDHLYFSRINRKKGKLLYLTDWQEVPFGPHLQDNEDLFADFLKNSLEDFCKGSHSMDIWTNISPDKTLIHRMMTDKTTPQALPETVFWTFKKETGYTPTEAILDYEVCEICQGDTKKLAINAYAAQTREINRLTKIFNKAQYPLAGITLPFLAAQNFFKTSMISAPSGPTLDLYIADNHTYLTVYENGQVVLSRTIKYGLNNLINALTQDKSISPELAKDILFESAHSLSSSQPQPKQEEIDQILSLALDRIANKIERTVEYYAVTMKKEIAEKIYLSGPFTQCSKLIRVLETKINIELEPVNPFKTSLYQGIPNDSQPLAMADSVSLALSNTNTTLNFLFTFRSKLQFAAMMRRKWYLFGVFLGIMLLLFGAWSYANNMIEGADRELKQARKKLAGSRPYITTNDYNKLILDIKSSNKMERNSSKKSLALASLNELTQLTPENIRLIRITGSYNQPFSSKKNSNVVEIEGIVTGPVKELELSLAKFMLALKQSPMFSGIRRTNKSFDTFQEVQILKFKLKVQVTYANLPKLKLQS